MTETRLHQRWIAALVLAGGVLLGAAIAAFASPVTWARWSAGFQVREYLNTHQVRKLQIGAGGQDLPGWLNTDIAPRSGEAYLDATKRFPFPDQSVNYIFAEQVIEHLDYSDGLKMFEECHRVLVPGGKVRIATPNLLKLVSLFQDSKTEEQKNYLKTKPIWHGWPEGSSPACIILNMELHEFGHQFVYDPDTLRARMMEAGFRIVNTFASGQSDDPALTGVENRQKWADLARTADAYETMVLQATK